MLNEKPSAGGKREKLLAGGKEEMQTLYLTMSVRP